MFIKKEVLTFDPTVFKKGAFITYQEVSCFERGMQFTWNHSDPKNAIVVNVLDEEIRITTADNKTHNIEAWELWTPENKHTLVKNPNWGYYQILGVTHSAITGDSDE
jgi:hypothetical protein